MLKRSISFLNKSMIKFSSVRRFSTSSNLDKLASILNQEISHEEKNYQAVEKSELERFFKDTKFEFVDKEDSTRMELRKSHGNFDVVVNFTARAPNMQEEEQDDKQGQEEKGNPSHLISRSRKLQRVHSQSY